MCTGRIGIRLRSALALLGVVACAVVSGCAGIDASLTERVSNINASLDQAINDGILLNIVRASRSQPLTFVAVSKVNSTQSVSLSNGLPALSFGPGLSTAQHQFVFGSNSISNSASGNFDLGPLATKEFAAGVSIDISLVELSTLIKEGIPRDLLFNLVVDSITYDKSITGPNGVDSWGTEYLRNDLDDRNQSYAGFRATALILTALGYSIETRADINPAWDASDKNTAKYKTTGHLCFDPLLADPNAMKILDDQLGKSSGAYFRSLKGNLVCGKWSNIRPTKFEHAPDTSIAIPLPGYPVKARFVVFKMRSIYGIFGFLGRLLKKGGNVVRTAEDQEGGAIQTDLYEALRQNKWEKIKHIYSNFQNQLLNTSPPGGAPCFASASLGGERYCVPDDESAANTKRVFSVLAQLMALKTTAADLPVTPTVRVTP
jgi:hypothetical protein